MQAVGWSPRAARPGGNRDPRGRPGRAARAAPGRRRRAAPRPRRRRRGSPTPTTGCRHAAVPSRLIPAGRRGDHQLVGRRPLAEPGGQVDCRGVGTHRQATPPRVSSIRPPADRDGESMVRQAALGSLAAATDPGACRAADAGCPPGPAAAGSLYQPAPRSKRDGTPRALGQSVSRRPGVGEEPARRPDDGLRPGVGPHSCTANSAGPPWGSG